MGVPAAIPMLIALLSMLASLLIIFDDKWIEYDGMDGQTRNNGLWTTCVKELRTCSPINTSWEVICVRILALISVAWMLLVFTIVGLMSMKKMTIIIVLGASLSIHAFSNAASWIVYLCWISFMEDSNALSNGGFCRGFYAMVVLSVVQWVFGACCLRAGRPRTGSENIPEGQRRTPLVYH